MAYEEAGVSELSLAELHDRILDALYRAAAWDNQDVRNAAYHAGAAAVAELHKRAAEVLTAGKK